MEQTTVCVADVPSCLHGCNLQDDPDSVAPSGSNQSSFWCGLTAAARANAVQHPASFNGCDEQAATSTSHPPAASLASQDAAPSEPQLGPEPETGITLASDDDLDQSDLGHATYMLPLQLLRHLHHLQQSISSDTWQMLWSIYAHMVSSTS